MYYAIIDNDTIKEVKEISQDEWDSGIANKHQLILSLSEPTLVDYFPASLEYLKQTINTLVSFGYTTKADIIAAISAE
jgi:hypothetical protein